MVVTVSNFKLCSKSNSSSCFCSVALSEVSVALSKAYVTLLIFLFFLVAAG